MSTPVKTLRIATRESPLALWQAEHVATRLRAQHADLQVELIGMTTAGDRFLDAPLAAAGGKGLFIKELEQCLIEARADLAVHSMKDVTIDLPEGLILSTWLSREDPRDVLISAAGQTLAQLPAGARVGTSSLRRQCQLRGQRPDLSVHDLRGNVGTRLGKLEAGEYDAIVLAAAGVLRLGLGHRISEFLAPEILLPAIGQGVIGIETRVDDAATHALLAPLNDSRSEIAMRAERACSKRLYGGCQLPIAAYAELDNEQLQLRGLVGRIDGSELLRAHVSGPVQQAGALGTRLADALLAQGADEILQDVLQNAAHD